MASEALLDLGQSLHGPSALSEGDLAAALATDREAIEERLRTLVREPVVREAIFVASPSLDDAVGAWLRDPKQPRARGVAATVLRYVARMSARATPFGLFSGCSTGRVGETTRLALDRVAAYRRTTRLDTHYLTALTEALCRDPEIRATLTVRPSTGLYKAAGKFRYAHAETSPTTHTRSYSLVSVTPTDYLEATLERASHGARPRDLARALVDGGLPVSQGEADAYVEELIDSQLLVPDLSPPLTGDDPLADVVATLRATGSTAAGKIVSALESVESALRALDGGGLGNEVTQYRAIAERLAPLPAAVELGRLFQVDLYKPSDDAVLGAEVVTELKRAIALSARIAVPQENEAFKRFRQAFVERYDRATVPLVEVLDEEAGIGFDGGRAGAAEPTPLLEGIALGRGGSSVGARSMFGRREAHLLSRLAALQATGETTLRLDDRDLEAISSGSIRLPDAFAAMATVAATSATALARGDFELRLHGLSGPSGARILARFCRDDATLNRAVQEHLRAEEALRPDVVFAEVVHLSDGRLGNIAGRPVLREHEIVYLARSSAPTNRQIPITDLQVSIRGERVVLTSARLGCEIVPRMTNAHNFSSSTLNVYRFLCSLSLEHERTGGWSWGALAELPCLPRVTHGRIVLSPARFRLGREQVSALVRGTIEDQYRAIQAQRRALGLPRWVSIEDGDNVLPVDLDSVLHIESFVQLIKSRSTVTLVEDFDHARLAVTGPEGHFVHQIVLPFTRARSATATTPPRVRGEPFEGSRAPRSGRDRPPGSEWLYAKLYTGTAGADSVLEQVVDPVVTAARAAGIAENWFFIRYADPETHVRLRIRGRATELAAKVLPALHDAASPLLRDGRIWKLQLDTYQREIERYGGPHAIELSERLFEADSDAVLRIVTLLEPAEAADARWRLALRGMDLLLADFGLDLERRLALVRELRESFAREHGVTIATERQLGTRFRAERRSLEALRSTPVGTEHPLDPGFELLAVRSKRNAEILVELRARREDGTLETPLDDLAKSLLHMHANRLLRSEARAQETVLYDFLVRLYESELARARRGRS